MSIGEGLAFASLMWAIVQISCLLHHRSKSVVIDDVKDRMDRIGHQLEEIIGPLTEPYTPAPDLGGVYEKYNELIMSVERKFPGETRHETALRYIRRMEEPSDICASKAQ